jgi:glycosyltransferase involved in cell wall biosynthesis
MRGLLESGIDIDIYSIYPLDPNLWDCIPDILNERVFPHSRIHHININKCLTSVNNLTVNQCFSYFKDVISILTSAIRYGFTPLAKSAYASIKAWGWAHQEEKKYDHILAYWGNYSATCAYLFQRLTNRNIGFSMFLHAGTDLYRDNVFLKQKLLYADNIFVVCEYNRQFIQEHFPTIYPKISKKIYVYHLGLDFNEFPYSPDNRVKSKIIAVGSLTRLKGFDYLLLAVKELASSGIELEVDLIGDGEERSSLNNLAFKLGVADHVKFYGWLPFEEVKKAMLQASLLVHPSSDIGDAVPTVIKEALALGTPVIASNVAGIPEILDYGKCGELVPPRDINALANAINKLLQDEALRRDYAEKGRKFAETKFNLWKNGQQLAELLESSR